VTTVLQQIYIQRGRKGQAVVMTNFLSKKKDVVNSEALEQFE
jgi:hypothetical protein